MSPMIGKMFMLLLLLASHGHSLCQAGDEAVDKTKLSEYFLNEQYPEAIEYLESRKVYASSDLNAINALGYAHFMNDNYPEAERHYARTLSLDSLNFTANRYAALISNVNKHYDNQLFYYLRLLRVQPSNAMLYKLTGDTYSLLKQPDSSLKMYARAYSLQSSNEKIASAYADNLVRRELFVTADSVTKAFLAGDTLNRFMLRIAVKSYMAQKKMPEAAALTNRWLLANEIDLKTAVSLSIANYHIKDYEVAYKVCDTLISQGIDNESVFYYAAQAKHKLKDYGKSIELLRHCLVLAISDQTNIYYFSLADNYEALKEYKKSVQAYDTAFYLFKDPLALYNLGRLYETSFKDPSRARQYFKRYLALARPKTPDEKRVYAYVKEMLNPEKK